MSFRSTLPPSVLPDISPTGGRSAVALPALFCDVGDWRNRGDGQSPPCGGDVLAGQRGATSAPCSHSCSVFRATRHAGQRRRSRAPRRSSPNSPPPRDFPRSRRSCASSARPAIRRREGSDRTFGRRSQLPQGRRPGLHRQGGGRERQPARSADRRAGRRGRQGRDSPRSRSTTAAPRHPRRAGHADARLARPARAARRRRHHVPQSRSRPPFPRSMRRSPRRPTPRVKARLEQARASAVLVSDLPEADKLAAIDVLAARGDREALSLLTSFEASADGALKDAAASGDRRHQQLARHLVGRPERLVRHLARLGAAARGDRPCHHLRRHGRHQHGAWRDGDARRLHHLRRAGS